jgi:putative transposase
MAAAETLAHDVGVAPACSAFSIPRAAFYRHRQRHTAPPSSSSRPTPARALATKERHQVLEELNSDRFRDTAPAAVYAQLLDEGRYLCSIRTMYRLMHQAAQVRERRDQLTHPPYRKPELLATGPDQLWSWDITKLRGPAKWTYYYLYVILDVFSRYVVGWMLAPRESAELAKRLIGETCRRFQIPEGQLTIHADRGSSMTSKPVAFLPADLGVTKTHSRPHVSDDNPYSESQFRTMKYRPEFPDRFGSIQDGRAFCQRFFPWYNDEHRHSGIGLPTPASLHFGLADQAQLQRQAVLTAAYQHHPERFVRRPPKPFDIPKEVWINKPPSTDQNTQ